MGTDDTKVGAKGASGSESAANSVRSAGSSVEGGEGGEGGEAAEPAASDGPVTSSEDTLASKKRSAHAAQSADPSALAHAVDRLATRIDRLELRIATVEQVTNAMRSQPSRATPGGGQQVTIRILIALVIILIVCFVIFLVLGK
jgi:hypothetical protein